MDVPPPAAPPPLLTSSQLTTLFQQGHLPITLPPHLQTHLTALSKSSKSFFSCPVGHKQASYPQSHGTESGYHYLSNEKEYITLRAHKTDSINCSRDDRSNQNLEQSAAEVWRHTAALLHRILSDVSRELCLDTRVWENIVEGALHMPESLNADLPTLLRVFNYFPTDGVAGAHKDLGLLTLCVGNGKGLQVWQKNDDALPSTLKPHLKSEAVVSSSVPSAQSAGEWVDVCGPTILAGLTLQVLSSDRVLAGLHRVVGNDQGRNSIVFALRPCLRSEIKMEDFGGSGAVAMNDVWGLVKGGRVNVNAQKHVREKQMREQKSRSDNANEHRQNV